MNDALKVAKEVKPAKRKKFKEGGIAQLSIHPARLIPGAHIREEDYGHPVFTGALHG